MARMAAGAKKRPRRSFTEEFKAGAVRLVLDEGKTVSQVGRDLDVSQSVVGNWVKQARADRSNGKTGLTTEERGELVKQPADPERPPGRRRACQSQAGHSADAGARPPGPRAPTVQVHDDERPRSRVASRMRE